MQNSSVLVTGSSGMIGTRLCEKLIEKNYTVIGVDKRPNQWNSSIDLQSIKIDLRDKRKVLDLLPQKIDLIIHLAANARVYNLVFDPSQARDNFELTFNILEFARIHNIKRVIFSSSREVYGNSNYFSHAEDPVDIKSCESPYAATKVAGEAIFWAYARCYGIDFIIFRFSNVYGMYDDTDRVVPLFLKRAAQGKSLTVFGKEKVVDFTYIDDTIMAIINGIDRFDYVKNQVFNIAGSKGVPLLTVAELVKSKLHSDSDIILEENRVGEIMKYVADISKAKSVLGYTPETDIQEGLDKTIRWYLQYQQPLLI